MSAWSWTRQCDAIYDVFEICNIVIFADFIVSNLIGGEGEKKTHFRFGNDDSTAAAALLHATRSST